MELIQFMGSRVFSEFTRLVRICRAVGVSRV